MDRPQLDEAACRHARCPDEVIAIDADAWHVAIFRSLRPWRCRVNFAVLEVASGERAYHVAYEARDESIFLAGRRSPLGRGWRRGAPERTRSEALPGLKPGFSLALIEPRSEPSNFCLH